MKGTINEGEVKHLPIDDLPPHPVIEFLERNNVFQIEDGEIEALAESLLNINLLQPIVVTEENGKFYRVAGRRRLLAAKKRGLLLSRAILGNFLLRKKFFKRGMKKISQELIIMML